jgi:hypothetical protein
MKSEAEIKSEIVALKDVLARLIRPVDCFGVSNKVKIETLIKTLESGKSEDDVIEYYEGKGYEYDHPAFQAARDAAAWVEDQSDDRPSEGWDHLCSPKPAAQETQAVAKTPAKGVKKTIKTRKGKKS